MPSKSRSTLRLLLVMATFIEKPAFGLLDPLISASMVADVERVEDLLGELGSHVARAGAAMVDTSGKDDLGRTALMVCGIDPQADGHDTTNELCAKIGRLLLGAGADKDAQDFQGWSVAAYASSLGWSSLVKVLAENGANLRARDNKGLEPLHKVRHSRHCWSPSCLLDESGALLFCRLQSTGEFLLWLLSWVQAVTPPLEVLAVGVQHITPHITPQPASSKLEASLGELQGPGLKL